MLGRREKGGLYRLEPNNIYNMDCLEGMKLIPDKSVDAVVTDPPFGIGFKYKKTEQCKTPGEYWTWLKPIYSEILRVTKGGGFIAVGKNFVQMRKTPINYGL